MKNTVDELLGKVTMYRLVIYGLLAIAATALLLMTVGNIGYTPLLFASSLIVVTSISYASNRLFGWLFGVKAHGESAIITGLILALLFIPPDSVIEFVKLGLVAMIAMASKYLIAPRGRHIFNPAAIAIVIASIGGLAYAGWWVATPALIPVTVIAGGLILYKTQKQYVSLVFVITAVIMLLLQGTDPYIALTSWPLLFVGAIMLSEPLTLPPRAQQQYFVAVLVGVLMTLPLHYGRITMTPALALVIGNIIGWWFGQRRSMPLRYIGKKQLGEDTYSFIFDTKNLVFEPGQYIEMTLPHAKQDGRGQRRVFSIVGSPGDEQISIGTKIPKKPSSFKRALLGLKLGDTIQATRIAGDFVLPKDPNQPVVLIAGGIGITPYISYIQSTKRPMKIIYAVSSSDEISFAEQLRHHVSDVTIVSPESAKLPDPEWRHIQGRLGMNTLKDLIDVRQQPHVYVSGPPHMVNDVQATVKALGIKQIKVDEFSGY